MKNSNNAGRRAMPATSQGAGLLLQYPAGLMGRKVFAVVAAAGLLIAGAGIVHADIIYNDVDGSIDTVAEIMPLNVGTNGATSLYIQPKNGDGEGGCNVKGAYSVTLSLVSSHPAVATVSPGTVTIEDCGTGVPLTVTPLAEGSATITAAVSVNNSPGTFSVSEAAFRVDVASPANEAPRLTIDGVATGGSYAKGAVPAAICKVTDAEDGPSSFAAELSGITGPDAAFGIGSQTARCSHTDTGGLAASSSVTYSITDSTGPAVSYTLSPAEPDGSNFWYKTNVFLDWTVTESDSPSTLTASGCEDQTISADQIATTYTCSATSSGGTSSLETVAIKRDSAGPKVSYTSASGTVGKAGWYTSPVTATFTGVDTLSGPASATQTAVSSGEGANVPVTSPAFQDLAGNTTAAGAAGTSFNIDYNAPVVTYTGADRAPNINGWYNAPVTATFTGTDAVSGPASQTQQVTSSTEGAAVELQSPAFEDVAGNVRPAGADKAAFQIDTTAPGVAFDGTLIGNVYFGSVPASPTCTATDALSGTDALFGEEGCLVTGYSTLVGSHTLTATAKDKAGNISTVEQKYEVLPWTAKGFYQPVDMGNVVNTVKAGSTVPAKFELFIGSREIADTSVVSMTVGKTTCTASSVFDEIELTASGNTSLRYDATAGQYIYNWKTPATPGACYKLNMTALDGSVISAMFKLK